MRAIDALRAEHERIHHALATLVALAEKLATNAPVEPDAIERSLEFFDRFADGVHHAKEELVLFPALERAGLPRDRGSLAVMCTEHARARALLRRMTDAARDLALVPAARSRFVTAATAYADLLANHIGKEDGVVFVTAERLLGPEEAAALDEAFDRFDASAVEQPRGTPSRAGRDEFRCSPGRVDP